MFVGKGYSLALPPSKSKFARSWLPITLARLPLMSTVRRDAGKIVPILLESESALLDHRLLRKFSC